MDLFFPITGGQGEEELASEEEAEEEAGTIVHGTPKA